MNCDTVRRQLFGSESPDQPSPAVQGHLAHCPLCRTAQRRLLQAERQILLLPVPPAERCEVFLQRVLQAPLPERAALPAPVKVRWPFGAGQPGGPTVREGGRRKLALAFALAAGLAAFALAWWALPHGSQPQRQDLLAQLEERRAERLRDATTPRQRADVLAKLADEVFVEAQTADAPRLAHLATFYSELVRRDLPACARALPAAERAAFVGPVVERLGSNESAALHRAADADCPPEVAEKLKGMAKAAIDGRDQLRALLREVA